MSERKPSSPPLLEPVAVEMGQTMHGPDSEAWRAMSPEKQIGQERRRVRILRGIIEVAADQTKRLRAENEQARVDTMTGMFTRNAWEEIYPDYVERAQAQAERGADTGLVLMIIDIDGMKTINDTLGHDEGDGGISLVAERIKKANRPGDVEARLGGDEFAVLMEGVIPRRGESFEETMASIAGETAQSVDEGLHSETGRKYGDLGMGVSIGYAHFEPGMTATDLYNLADAHMYEEKKAKGAER
jgi:diguanylate cyclase (GGDEF)-like protein